MSLVLSAKRARVARRRRKCCGLRVLLWPFCTRNYARRGASGVWKSDTTTRGFPCRAIGAIIFAICSRELSNDANGQMFLRVTRQKRHILLIISIGRLEATADADGDIGRSSQLDHSKELDLYFPELYWSSFLGSVQKKNVT